MVVNPSVNSKIVSSVFPHFMINGLALSLFKNLDT